MSAGAFLWVCVGLRTNPMCLGGAGVSGGCRGPCGGVGVSAGETRECVDGAGVWWGCWGVSVSLGVS